jgi:hypothetical protein
MGMLWMTIPVAEKGLGLQKISEMHAMLGIGRESICAAFRVHTPYHCQCWGMNTRTQAVMLSLSFRILNCIQLNDRVKIRFPGETLAYMVYRVLI